MLHMMIVDDDNSVVNVLKDIVSEHFEDIMLSTALSGREAIERITIEQPDIVLLDYLLPDCDGLHVIRQTTAICKPKIIMISEVSDKQMIAKAYCQNISFFITKPVNVIEVVAVINQVISSYKAHKTIRDFEKAIQSLNNHSSSFSDDAEHAEKALKRLYSKLGISGVSGCDDLIKAVIWASKRRGDYSLSELYGAIVVKDRFGQLDDHQLQAVKKRINRVISKAFRILATMGLEDPYNPIFEDYGSQLFDYSELRVEMKLIEGISVKTGKINIKQFIESSLVLIDT